MKILFMILGMSLVTYIPRVLPVHIMKRLVLPDYLKRWLQSIPYAALGALIFPGILTVDESNPLAGWAGGITAVVMSFFRLNIMYVLLGSVLAVMGVKMLMG